MPEGLAGGFEGGDRVSEKGMREGAGDGDLMRRRLEDRLTRAGNLRQPVAIEPGSAEQSQAGVLPETGKPGALDAEVEKVEAEAVQPLGAGAGEGLTTTVTWMEKAFGQKTNYGAGESIKDRT